MKCPIHSDHSAIWCEVCKRYYCPKSPHICVPERVDIKEGNVSVKITYTHPKSGYYELLDNDGSILAQIVHTEPTDWTILFKDNTYVSGFDAPTATLMYGTQYLTIKRLETEGVLTVDTANELLKGLL